MMCIENDFELGDEVYLKTDTDQEKRIITCILVKPGDKLMYELSYRSSTSNHYDFEFTYQPDVILKTTN